MSQYVTQLFNNLQNLVATNEAFFSKDVKLDDSTYRVYNYRLASYSDFLLPDARESRGIMFEIDKDGNPIRIACHMPKKFFNLNENPFTMNLELNTSTVESIMIKMDGSIISTFWHNGGMKLKSKTSLDSEHAQAAWKWLQDPRNIELRHDLEYLTSNGFSVHMEFTSPDPSLRIVVGYPKSALTILAIRNNQTGVDLSPANLIASSQFNYRSKWEIVNHWVPMISPLQLLYNWQSVNFAKFALADTNSKDTLDRILPKFNFSTVEEFLKNVYSEIGLEGYVIRLKNGEMIKIKTDWYCALHHSKDSINSTKRLFQCVLQEATDDLKSMFAEDLPMLERINKMEQLVMPQFNHIIATVEKYAEENKDLSRKDYAIKAQAIQDGLFGLKMNVFLGKTNDYRSFAMDHMDLFDLGSLSDIEVD